MTVILVLGAATTVLALAFAATAGTRYFSAPALYLIWLSLTFIMRPVMLLMGWDEPYPPTLFGGPPTGEIMVTTLLYCLWVFTFAGAYLASRQPAQALSGVFPRFTLNPDARALLLVLAGFTVVSVSGAIYSLAVTGFNFESAQRAVRIEKMFAGLSIIPKLPGTVAFLCVAGLLHQLKELQARRTSVIFVYAIAALLFMNFAANWTYADRSGIFFPLIVLAIGLSTIYRSVGPGSVLVGVAGIIGIAMLLHSIRFAEVSAEEKYSSVASWVTRALNLNTYDTLLIVVRDWGGRQLRYGADFWNGIIGLIPRGLWPEKPVIINSGNFFAAYYNPNKESGTPITTIGEWYSNFSVPGVAVGGALGGFIYRALALRFRDYAENPLAFTCMAYIILNVTVFGVSNNLLRNIIIDGVPLFAFIFAVQWLTMNWGHSRAAPRRAVAAPR